MELTNLELYNINKKRIDDGFWKIGDFSYKQCANCRGKDLHGCLFLIRNGYPSWTCGLCQRGLIKKGEDVVYKVAVDADSLVNKALHRYPLDMEMAYSEFCSEIGKIKGAVFFGYADYEKGDTVEVKIVLTPRTNFRYDIYPEYKAGRPERSDERIALMKLIVSRLKPITEIHKNVEADDVVIYYAKQGWLVAAIDKDVKNACPTSCYDYNKYEWKEPSPPYIVEKWYLIQAIMGDSTDNIKGVKGIGEKGAYKIIEELDYPTFADIVPYFPSFEEALLSMRLVRMDQWNGSEVVLWSPTVEESLI